jgi:hypothetical protein
VSFENDQCNRSACKPIQHNLSHSVAFRKLAPVVDESSGV